MIKKVSEENINECVEVIRKSFKTVADEFGFTEENASRFTAFSTTYDRINYQFDVEHRPMFIFLMNNKVVGYYSLLLQENKECELNNLCVLPEYRKNKIGEQLLNSAFDKAKEYGCSIMNIGIVEENVALRKWYENYGFIHVGTEKYDFFPFTCGYMKKKL